MKQRRFGMLLVLFTGIAAVTAGCSPLSPSVSKLSNATAQKTIPEDSSAALHDLVEKSTKQELADQAQGASAATVLVPSGKFRETLLDVPRTHPLVKVPAEDLEPLKTSGRTTFSAGEDIGAQNPDLARTPTRVFLAVKGLDSSSIDKLNKIAKIGVTPCLDGLARTCPDGHHWTIELKQPSVSSSADEDPIQAIALEKLRAILLQSLTGVAVEFKADL